MNFSEAFKVFQINVLRQSGIMVTPEQVGLKKDPIAELQAKSNQGAFGQFLSQVAGTSQLAGPPAPPVPPENTADEAAMLKYHQDLLIYNNENQKYNQQFMQLVLQRLAQIQQQMALQNRNTQQNTASSSGLSAGSLGIGGILGGVDS